MAKMETITRTHDDRKKENRSLGEQTVYGRIADKLRWLNEPAKNKYTLGAAVRKMLFMKPSEHGFHTSRIGRFVERACMIPAAVACFALLPPPTGVLVGLLAAKCYSMGAGFAADLMSKGLENTMRKIDHKKRVADIDIDQELDRVGVRRGLHQNNDENRFSRKNQKDGLVGTRESSQEVGTRETPQMERPEDMVGVREFKETSIQTTFKTVASRTFDPAGPRPRENFDLPTGNGPKKAGQGMGA